MALIQYAAPWNRQPQEAVEANWSNPLAAELQMLVNSSIRRDVVTGAAGESYGTVNQSSVKPSGIGTSVPSQTIAGFKYGATKKVLNDRTLFLYISEFSESGSYVSGMSLDNTCRIILKNGSTASGAQGLYDWIAIGTGPNLATYSGPITMVYSLVEATDSHFLYINGDLVASVSGGTRYIDPVPVGTSLFVNNFGSSRDQGANSSIAMAGVAGRAWSAGEARQFSDNPWQLFAPQTIWVPVSAGGGGPTNYPVTLSESVTSADACSVMIGFAPVVAETVTALDTSSQLAALSKSIAETAAALDTAMAVVARVGTVAETAAAADTRSIVTGFAVTRPETATAADSASAVAAFAKTMAESGTAADTVSQVASLAKAVAETVTAVDSVNGSAAGNYAGTITEAGSATDTSSQVAALNKAVTESGAAADSISQVASLAKSIAETASAADTTSGTATGDYAGTVTEAGSAVDTQSNIASLTATTIEAASAADVAAAAKAVSALIAEAMAAVDSVNASASGEYFGIVAESGAAIDTASQAAAMFGTVAESANAMDSAYVFNAWMASISESATAADVVSQLLNAIDAHSVWWLYVVPTDDLSFAVSASSLAYRTGV